MKRKIIFIAAAFASTIWLSGCGPTATNTNTGSGGTATSGGGGKPAGPFSLAWSEYPSWSVFGVADTMGLIKAGEGKLGTLEEKWGVDVILNELSYDGCLGAYGNGSCDAVCITNMDVLAPASGRTSVAILPTSTSDGADACIATGISSIEELKGVPSWGLEKSVSQYMFERALQVKGFDPAEFPFSQKDPEVAAQAMQTNDPDTKSIVVWNPFVIQTLRLRSDATVLFDSTAIPEEIVDMLVVGEDSLKKPGGDAFAGCIVEAFYAVNAAIEDSATQDDTLIKLGKKFGDVPLEDMKKIVVQTKFYKTPDEGVGLFEKEAFKTTLMPRVVDFCATHDIIEAKPTVSFDGSDAQLKFDTSFMKAAKKGTATLAN